MDVQSFIASALRFNQETCIAKTLRGLTDEDLLYRPNAHTNPMGWLLWHQARAEDGLFSRLSNTPQTWLTGQWHATFGMAPDPDDRGIGHSLEQVMAFRATVAHLQGYAAAVREKTLATLQSFTPEDLEREVPAFGGTRKVGELLGVFLIDQLHHSGQVCYLRGSLTPGWSLWP